MKVLSLIAILLICLPSQASFLVDLSFNYHSISITKETNTDNVETEVTNAYTTIYPMIEISFRFR